MVWASASTGSKAIARTKRLMRFGTDVTRIATRVALKDSRQGRSVAAGTAWWYIGGMKMKTSVTLSEELLEALSREAGQANRSALIEEATWRYLRERQREKRDARELERINEHAERLNEEALDVLSFQTEK
jgi:hypothetical protein